MKLNPRHIRQLSLWPNRIMLLCCALLFACIQVSAQEGDRVTITGKVTLGSGTDLAGTTVQVKGDQKGVNTDAEGNYSINAPARAIPRIQPCGLQTG